MLPASGRGVPPLPVSVAGSSRPTSAVDVDGSFLRSNVDTVAWSSITWSPLGVLRGPDSRMRQRSRRTKTDSQQAEERIQLTANGTPTPTIRSGSMFRTHTPLTSAHWTVSRSDTMELATVCGPQIESIIAASCSLIFCLLLFFLILVLVLLLVHVLVVVSKDYQKWKSNWRRSRSFRLRGLMELASGYEAANFLILHGFPISRVVTRRPFLPGTVV